MALLLRYAIRSHVGLIRDGNEDSGYAGPRLLAIADGMGGAAAGELASAVVMATVARLDEMGGGETQVSSPASAETMQISQHDLAAMTAGGSGADAAGLGGEPDLALLGGAVVAANERLRAIVAERPELEGMGTTLTAMLWSGGRFGMVHVGDSRAYRLRDGLLEQMTADHTWVQRLIDEGRITEEEAGHHPQRSLLMRVLDGRTQVEADIGTFDAYPGDRYLLCSDGLSGFVSQETLAETLAAYPDPQQAVDALIELALRAGGPDNITCIVADTIDDGSLGGTGGNEATQLLGSVTRVVVGAASEGVDRLPRFTSPPQPAGPPPQDEFPQNHPAGRAARLRPRRNANANASQQQAVQTAPAAPPHPGAPLGAPPQYDPAAVTAELDAVPGQREAQTRRRPVAGSGGGGAEPDTGKSHKKSFLIAGAAVLVLAAGAVGGYLYSQGKYYVGVSSDGRQVVVYKGISQVSFLSSQATASGKPLYLSQIPVSQRGTVKENKAFSSEQDASKAIDTYRQAAQSCSDFRKTQAQGGQTPSPQPSTGASVPNVATKPGNVIPSGPGATTSAGNDGGAALPSSTTPSAAETTPGLPPDTQPSTPTTGTPPSSNPAQAGDQRMAQYCAGTTDGPS
jgi:protein phosphatase